MDIVTHRGCFDPHAQTEAEMTKLLQNLVDLVVSFIAYLEHLAKGLDLTHQAFEACPMYPCSHGIDFILRHLL